MNKNHLIIFMLIISVGMNIALLTNTPNNDIVILDIVENSHFIGCGRVSLDFEYCHKLSKQFRKEYRDKTGMEDRTR